MFPSNEELNRRTLTSNVENSRPKWSPQQVNRAVDVALIAFKGQTGNGEAARIGVETVEMQDRQRTS